MSYSPILKQYFQFRKYQYQVENMAADVVTGSGSGSPGKLRFRKLTPLEQQERQQQQQQQQQQQLPLGSATTTMDELPWQSPVPSVPASRPALPEPSHPNNNSNPTFARPRSAPVAPPRVNDASSTSSWPPGVAKPVYLGPTAPVNLNPLDPRRRTASVVEPELVNPRKKRRRDSDSEPEPGEIVVEEEEEEDEESVEPPAKKQAVEIPVTTMTTTTQMEIDEEQPAAASADAGLRLTSSEMAEYLRDVLRSPDELVNMKTSLDKYKLDNHQLLERNSDLTNEMEKKDGLIASHAAELAKLKETHAAEIAKLNKAHAAKLALVASTAQQTYTKQLKQAQEAHKTERETDQYTKRRLADQLKAAQTTASTAMTHLATEAAARKAAQTGFDQANVQIVQLLQQLNAANATVNHLRSQMHGQQKVYLKNNLDCARELVATMLAAPAATLKEVAVDEIAKLEEQARMAGL